MNALVCELCGGNDIVKDNGYYICQNCGTKFTVEEARKMMIDGTVDVQGSVKIDRSLDVQKILKNADTTFNTKNYSEAFKLYSQVLNIDTENSHAILYRAICSGWESTIKDFRLNEVDLASKQAIHLEHVKMGDTKDYFDFCYNAIQEVDVLTNLMIQKYVDFLVKTYPELAPQYTIGTDEGWSHELIQIAKEIRETYNNGTNSCLHIISNVIHYSISGISDYSNIDIKLMKLITRIADKCTWYVKVINQAYINKCTYLSSDDTNIEQVISYNYPFIKTLKKDIENVKQKAIHAANDKYWKAHPEKKAALIKERSELVSTISSLENEKKNLPGQLEKVKLQQKIDNLNNEKNALGMFKLKKKKEIQNSIEEATDQLNQINKSLDEPLSRINGKIKCAKRRITEIDTELNKDRR